MKIIKSSMYIKNQINNNILFKTKKCLHIIIITKFYLKK